MKILQMIGSVAIATSIVTVAAIVSPVTANAATFSFQNITGGDNFGDAIFGQFKFDVTDSSDGKTLWKFSNSAGTTNSASFISRIYFDYSVSSVLSAPTFNSGLNVGTVAFKSTSVNPANLPQSTNIGFNADLAIGSVEQGANKDGIDLGETLGVIFNSPSASVIEAAINSGNLRVGIHVQDIAVANGRSDSYINTKPVPVPGFLLGVMAAGALGSTRLLKNKKQAV